MAEKNLELLPRNNEFYAVIKQTIYTNKQAETLEVEQGYSQLIELCLNVKENGSVIYIIGNGGSAAIASHTMTDLVNTCSVPTFTLHDPPLLTCMTNDFGYEHAYKRILNTVFRRNDMLIAISSSGQSPNMCNAAKVAKKREGTVITFTGFQSDNPLRKLGDLNFWLNSNDYGLVEIGHLFLLHNLADRMAMRIKQQHDQLNALIDLPISSNAT